MAYSTNLNLYIPTKEDYVNVKRDLADNFQKIDDAVGWKLIKKINNTESPASVIINLSDYNEVMVVIGFPESGEEEIYASTTLPVSVISDNHIKRVTARYTNSSGQIRDFDYLINDNQLRLTPNNVSLYGYLFAR